MVKLVFLSSAFFNDYSGCKELEKKTDRPYACAKLELNGVTFCIPMRSNIRHKYALFTDKENCCGLDFTKTVVIAKECYIDNSRKPYIRPNEFDVIKKMNEHDLQKGLTKYIKEYKKAKAHPNADHNKMILRYSSLQYFEGYI